MTRLATSAFFAILLLSCAFALTNLPPGAFRDDTLAGSITIENRTLLQSPETVRVAASLENPSGKAYALYLMKFSGGRWEMMQAIGSLGPFSSVDVKLDVKLEYPGQSVKSTRYAIIAYSGEGAGEGNVLGKSFVLDEDWGKYEENFRKSLAQANIFIVPVLTLALIIVVFVLAESAYRRHLCDATGCEYNTRTLFFPRMSGRPLGEQVSDLIVNPFFWLFEALCTLAIVAVIYNANMLKFGIETGTAVFVMAGLGAITLPLVYFGLAWWAEYYNKKPIRFFFALFMWGTFGAFLSFLFNSIPAAFLYSLFASPEGRSSAMIIGTVLVAPVVEEIAKALGIFLMAGHSELNDTLTGLLFGFATGAGFAFVENWFYFASKANPLELGLVSWFGLIVYRSFFNTLAHGSFTAAASAIVGYMKCHPPVARYMRLGFIPGIFLAFSLHAMFNISALLDGYAIANYRFTMFIFNPLLVAMLAVLFLVVFVLAQKESQHLAAKKAGAIA